jgi:hypothetical protein
VARMRRESLGNPSYDMLGSSIGFLDGLVTMTKQYDDVLFVVAPFRIDNNMHRTVSVYSITVRQVLLLNDSRASVCITLRSRREYHGTHRSTFHNVQSRMDGSPTLHGGATTPIPSVECLFRHNQTLRHGAS